MRRLQNILDETPNIYDAPCVGELLAYEEAGEFEPFPGYGKVVVSKMAIHETIKLLHLQEARLKEPYSGERCVVPKDAEHARKLSLVVSMWEKGLKGE